MKIYKELPKWYVDPGDESDSKYFMFKGEVVVEAYPDDEYHTDTVVNAYYPALVYCHADNSDDYGTDVAMTLDGCWVIYSGDDFGGEWIGPIDWDDLKSVIEKDHFSLAMDGLRSSLDDVYGMEPAKAVEHLIGIYKHCKSMYKFISEIEASAKEGISEIMEETGQLEWDTQSGKCMVTAPGVRVSYDAARLDGLAASDPEIAKILSPYRKESQTTGSMRIT